jgi:hypothetical protein
MSAVTHVEEEDLSFDDPAAFDVSLSEDEGDFP